MILHFEAVNPRETLSESAAVKIFEAISLGFLNAPLKNEP
jgi:hypothetical protein